jgi:tRNA modification GTPase
LILKKPLVRLHAGKEAVSQDTIFALSSGAPPSGVAVFRISGPGVRFGLETLIGRLPPARTLVLADVVDPRSGEFIDRGLAVFFQAPTSFTGEDVGEIHVHGGRAVIAALSEALGRITGFRLAERGEFTRRAFENGKLDLIAAEGLADLVAAETEMQRRQALRQAGGVLGAAYEDWRERLIRARAMIEAELDFAEDEELPATVAAEAFRQIGFVSKEITKALQDGRRGERLREGVEIVILGPPNSGKSSLLNALARREAAIVSPEPGTTRDLITVRMDVDGFPLTLIDTAGIRAVANPVEVEGIRRAEKQAAMADVALVLTDATGSEPPLDEDLRLPDTVVRVATKIDLLDSTPERLPGFDQTISVVTGAGLGALLETLSRLVAERVGATESTVITRQRHRDALVECLASLDRAGPELPLEVVAEELRTASDALARVTGRIDVEDWLGVIFREFCIGK